MTAPNTNGVMTMTDAETTSIRNKLTTIRDAFTPTDEQPVCNTFYLVSTYNKQNVGKEVNGDTAEFILK